MGQSSKKRSFSKKEIDQKWTEVLNFARQYATCEDEQLEVSETKLRLSLKIYLLMNGPFVNERMASDTAFVIFHDACHPAFDPLSGDQKLRLQQTLDKIIHEPRKWGYFDGWQKTLNRLKKYN